MFFFVCVNLFVFLFVRVFFFVAFNFIGGRGGGKGVACFLLLLLFFGGLGGGELGLSFFCSPLFGTSVACRSMTSLFFFLIFF